MEQQLNEYLLRLLDQIDTGIVTTADFLSAEIPLYIQELLLWYGVKSAIMSATALIVIIATIITVYKHSGKGEFIDSAKYYRKETLTHNKHGDVDGHAVLTFVCCVSITIFCVSIMNLDWLQIWIAPRVWLLEYASSMVK